MRMQTPTSQQTVIALGLLPKGVAGIAATLDLMVKLAREGRKSFAVRKLAEDIIRDVKQKDYVGEARAIQEYVRDHIRYTKDIRETETVSTPEQTIQRGMGDCDDKSLLVATLLESVGHPTRFVAVGRAPRQFIHVLVETRIASRWIPVETTENVPLGWYPPDMPYRLVRHV